MSDSIVNYLKRYSGSVSTDDIARNCSLTKSKVIELINNGITHVYLDKNGFYYYKDSISSELDKTGVNLVILVDLGNVHDCLQKLENYADNRCCDVFAYADQMSNCYGIKPPVKSKYITVKVASDRHKNSADIEMIWDCATLSNQYQNVVIVTKDLGFQTLVTKLKQQSRNVMFFHNYNDLEEYLINL